MPDRKKFLLRIDPSLYDALHAWADDELRSVNAHMEFVLRDALRKAGRLPGSKEGKSTGSRPEPEDPSEG